LSGDIEQGPCLSFCLYIVFTTVFRSTEKRCFLATVSLRTGNVAVVSWQRGALLAGNVNPWNPKLSATGDSTKEIRVPLIEICLNRELSLTDGKDFRGEKGLPGSINRRAVHAHLLRNSVPGERRPWPVPAIALADHPEENAPLGSAQARAQERLQEIRGNPNEAIWLRH
jgi:hypothetical protein